MSYNETYLLRIIFSTTRKRMSILLYHRSVNHLSLRYTCESSGCQQQILAITDLGYRLTLIIVLPIPGQNVAYPRMIARDIII
jgi:hypothetical protein